MTCVTPAIADLTQSRSEIDPLTTSMPPIWRLWQSARSPAAPKPSCCLRTSTSLVPTLPVAPVIRIFIGVPSAAAVGWVELFETPTRPYIAIHGYRQGLYLSDVLRGSEVRMSRWQSPNGNARGSCVGSRVHKVGQQRGMQAQAALRLLFRGRATLAFLSGFAVTSVGSSVAA